MASEARFIRRISAVSNAIQRNDNEQIISLSIVSVAFDTAEMRRINRDSEEQVMEREVFRYRRVCFSELQNTTYTEGTALPILTSHHCDFCDFAGTYDLG